MRTNITRLNVRLSIEQKKLFEYAASLSGYRMLTEFIISSAQNKADEIVQKHRFIIASKRDQKVFFDAISNPPAPGKKLSKAAKRHNKLADA